MGVNASSTSRRETRAGPLFADIFWESLVVSAIIKRAKGGSFLAFGCLQLSDVMCVVLQEKHALATKIFQVAAGSTYASLGGSNGGGRNADVIPARLHDRDNHTPLSLDSTSL
jgi:hypothetical protein